MFSVEELWWWAKDKSDRCEQFICARITGNNKVGLNIVYKTYKHCIFKKCILIISLILELQYLSMYFEKIVIK